MKQSTKIILSVAVCIILLGLVVYVQLEKYATDITDEELAIIEDYINYDAPEYCGNFIPLGEEKIDDNQTNYYGVLFWNHFEVKENKKLKGTFYLDKTIKEMGPYIMGDITRLDIIRTEGNGSNLKIISEDSAYSTEGWEKEPDAPNWFMIMRGKFYHASKKELKAMDEDDKARIAKLGYEVVAP